MKDTKILVVDDSHALLSTLEDILTGENYSVAIASDAASAEQQFASEQPDIVLLDVNLPDGNGLTITSQLKTQQQVNEWLPVILMSSDATVEDHLAGYKAGCDDYLSKPFDPRILLAKLAVVRRNLGILQ